ncbi:hypothetical protein, partial [Paenibacillus thiaminolyticus]|uniref:hypothetical protein n=1 Tax=Paenibacillus thiaminolyticus TaxID=49283 RepID=UPI00197FEED6
GDFEMAMPDMDITGIQSQMDALVSTIKASFGGAWDFIRNGWTSLVNTFGPSFSAAWGKFARFWNSGKWLSGSGTTTLSVWASPGKLDHNRPRPAMAKRHCHDGWCPGRAHG